jgi:hypothetical protein
LHDHRLALVIRLEPRHDAIGQAMQAGAVDDRLLLFYVPSICWTRRKTISCLTVALFEAIYWLLVQARLGWRALHSTRTKQPSYANDI